MFVSFFPRPRLFFLSVAGWTAITMALWYLGANKVPDLLGWMEPAERIVGVQVFWSLPFLWFYLYWAVATAIFAGFWLWYSPHPWAWWSILGSSLIIFVTYFQVQVSVAINDWYGPFYDMIQAALVPRRERAVTIGGVLRPACEFSRPSPSWRSPSRSLTRFFVSHYIFRWRTAMNDYYTANWAGLRRIEGASQRVQEDTMRFAEHHGGPRRQPHQLGDDVDRLPAGPAALVRQRHASCRSSAQSPIRWSSRRSSGRIFGTGFLALVGITAAGPGVPQSARRGGLPQGTGLRRGQRRPRRSRRRSASCSPPYARTTSGCTSTSRTSTSRAIFYLQTDNIFVFIILAPTIVAGKLTLGTFNQITQRVRAGVEFVPVSGQRLDDDRRAASRSTSACAPSRRSSTTSPWTRSRKETRPTRRRIPSCWARRKREYAEERCRSKRRSEEPETSGWRSGMRPDVLNPLFAPVTSLAGIGPKLGEILQRLLVGADGPEARVVDLLFHLPVGVVDRSRQPGIAEAAQGSIVTLKVRVDRHAKAPRNNPRIPYRVYRARRHRARSRSPSSTPAPTGWRRRCRSARPSTSAARWTGSTAGRPWSIPTTSCRRRSCAELPLIEPVYPMTAGLVAQGAGARDRRGARPRAGPARSGSTRRSLRQHAWPAFATGAAARPSTGGRDRRRAGLAAPHPPRLRRAAGEPARAGADARAPAAQRRAARGAATAA